MNPEVINEKPRIELYLGDCLDIMRHMPDKSIDLCLTDPPYGIDVQTVNCAGYRKDGRDRTKIDWDKNKLSMAFFEEIYRVSKDWIIWGANYYNCFSIQGGGQSYGINYSLCQIAANVKSLVFLNTAKYSNIPEDGRILLIRKRLLTQQKNPLS